MTDRLPELAYIPPGLVLDGELVAFNDKADPHFPLLSRRILNDDRAIPVTLMIFARHRRRVVPDADSVRHRPQAPLDKRLL
jgi:hypothetical protein